MNTDAANEPALAPAGPPPTSWLLIGVASILVFYMTFEQHFPIKVDVQGLNLTNILFMLVLAMLVFQKSYPVAPAPLKGSFALYFLTLLWAFMMGEMTDSSNLDTDLVVLKNDVFYPLFFFLFYYVARDLRAMRCIIAAILVTAFLATLEVFRQAMDYGQVGTYLETHRASGPFGYEMGASNSAAVYFVIFIPINFVLALKYRSSILVRCAALMGGLFGLVAIFLTYSRQAYLILAAITLMMAMRRSVILAALALIFVMNYQLWAPEGMITRIEVTQQVDQYGDVALDESTESRFTIWEGAAQLIKDKPWGIGLNHFAAEIGRYVPRYANYDAHNFFVRYTTEAGVVSIVIVALFLFNLMMLGVRVTRMKISQESEILGISFVIATLGVILGNLYGSRFQDPEVIANYWVLAGLTARFYTLHRGETAVGSDTSIAAPSPGEGPVPARAESSSFGG